jgi:hypothetical protein
LQSSRQLHFTDVITDTHAVDSTASTPPLQSNIVAIATEVEENAHVAATTATAPPAQTPTPSSALALTASTPTTGNTDMKKSKVSAAPAAQRLVITAASAKQDPNSILLIYVNGPCIMKQHLGPDNKTKTTVGFVMTNGDPGIFEVWGDDALKLHTMCETNMIGKTAVIAMKARFSSAITSNLVQ